jgi:hypothetical protein
MKKAPAKKAPAEKRYIDMLLSDFLRARRRVRALLRKVDAAILLLRHLLSK